MIVLLSILLTFSPYVFSQGTWTQVSGGAVQVAVDPSGNPWVVNDQGGIYRGTSTGFVKLSGLAYDIGIGANGDVWVIGTNQESGGYGIYKYVRSTNSWTKVNGGAVRIAVDPQGNPWVVNDQGYIYRYTSSGFVKLPGLATDIGVGANGDVWVIGTNQESGGYGIYKYVRSTNSWTKVNGGAVRISVDPKGNPWVVNDQGSIYQWTSGAFVQLPGLAQDIGIGSNGAVYVIGTDVQSGGYGIYRYVPEENPWTKIPGGAVQISVSPFGNPWVVNDQGYIYRRTSNEFVRLPGLANDIGIGANGAVWVIGTNQESGGYGIYRYRFRWNTWRKVSGGAVRIAVDPQGNPWVVNNQGYIYRRISGRFVKLSGLANDIGIGANGAVWVIGTNKESGGYGIYKYVRSTNSWTKVSGGAVRIAVDPKGNPWVVNDQGYIYRYTSGGFVKLPGLATDIGIGSNGAVYVVGTDVQSGGYGIYQYVG